MSRQLIFETSHRIERLICDHPCLDGFSKEWWKIDTLSVEPAMDVGGIMRCFRQITTLAYRVWSDIESKNLLPESRATMDPAKIDESSAYIIFHQNLSLLGTLIVGVWLKKLRTRNRTFFQYVADFFHGKG